MKRSLTFILPALALTGALAGGAACGTDNEPLPGGNGNTNMCNTQCSGDQVCAGTACEAAFPRVYSIRIENVVFADRDANGECWDEPGCGAPDPQVEIVQDGSLVETLDGDDDQHTLTFDDTSDLYFENAMKLELRLVDDDIDSNDLAVACTFETLTAAIIRGGDLSCEGNGSSIEASIEASAINVQP